MRLVCYKPSYFDCISVSSHNLSNICIPYIIGYTPQCFIDTTAFPEISSHIHLFHLKSTLLIHNIKYSSLLFYELSYKHHNKTADAKIKFTKVRATLQQVHSDLPVTRYIEYMQFQTVAHF